MSSRTLGLAAALALVLSIGSVPTQAEVSASLKAVHQRAEQGDAQAQVAWGRHLVEGSKADKAAATAWFRKAALQGNTDGEWMLGSAYMGGTGVPRDMAKALKWMRASLADGSAEHMATYGGLLFSQGMLEGHRQKGVAWLHKAADKGSPAAMMFMGMARLSGTFSLPKDQVEARHWFERAAQTGNPASEKALGVFYLKGMLGQVDIPKGLHWLRAAAAQGDASAEGTLAVYLVSGQDKVPKQPLQGLAWARKATAQHDAYGYYALGLAYQDGEGVTADPAKAWYNFAVAQRLDSKHNLTHVADHMSDVATGLRLKQLHQLRDEVAKVPVPKKHGES
ncbi:SEL1-like repeat protein [Oleiagrimonas sp. C23AA]|uniref:SEL1-like repeat protein n=1 Tax=Oleiagrimonas sp. C23AA TaxID=2719047 RepID=UPI00141DF2E7|nr:SEL1-like repeat protein [Oleiagrimonas sp. C23AA]NII12092.1 sel1 repeat family protein [Oleiagrimonas sp. C23AA]